MRRMDRRAGAGAGGGTRIQKSNFAISREWSSHPHEYCRILESQFLTDPALNADACAK
jgi:hypothetical protein